MKRIRVYECGKPEVMVLEDASEPKPENGQIVVKIHAAGVNPVDTYMRAGGQGYAPNLPYTPGVDAAGVIAAIGADVTGIAVGDRVYYAGAVSIPYATAYRALFHRANAKPGEIVLIHGASGGVGIAAVQLACAAGMTVIGTAGTGPSRQLVLAQGAHQVVDHHDPEHYGKCWN